MGGNGRLGNDLFGWFDPAYADQLPQRRYDPEHAKSLLSQAGYSGGLTLPTLPTAALHPSTNAMVALFAASAKAAGVKIQVDQQPTSEFYALIAKPGPWRPTSWGAAPIGAAIGATMMGDTYYTNETFWVNEDFRRAYKAATSSSDTGKQKDYLIDAQTIAYEDGGYIIPAFADSITATSSQVSGTRTNVRQEFGDFDFRGVTLT
jgi:peptide/nickel transport system substrate-binding protein